jgi:hypothetical protein
MLDAVPIILLASVYILLHGFSTPLNKLFAHERCHLFDTHLFALVFVRHLLFHYQTTAQAYIIVKKYRTLSRCDAKYWLVK